MFIALSGGCSQRMDQSCKPQSFLLCAASDTLMTVTRMIVFCSAFIFRRELQSLSSKLHQIVTSVSKGVIFHFFFFFFVLSQNQSSILPLDSNEPEACVFSVEHSSDNAVFMLLDIYVLQLPQQFCTTPLSPWWSVTNCLCSAHSSPFSLLPRKEKGNRQIPEFVYRIFDFVEVEQNTAVLPLPSENRHDRLSLD